MDNPPHRPPFRPILGMWDAVSIIAGVIIGATIFSFPPIIFASAGSAGAGLTAWALGGLASLVGALCYAELATAYRTPGGDFVYLSRAYGRGFGFIYAWAELSVIRTGGSIAAMAYIFGDYARELAQPAGAAADTFPFLAAAVAILALTFVNFLGMQPGRVAQNVLTAAKLLGLGGIVAVGFGWYFLRGTVPAPAETGPIDGTNFALAMVFVMYAYGGWNEAAFVAAEVRDPRRNIVRSLVIGTVAVAVVYLAVNLAYLAAFGYQNVCRSGAIASDLLSLPFGQAGRAVMAVLVMVSALGAINGLLFTGMRLYGNFGAHHRLFAGLADPHGRPQGSAWSLLAQALFSLFLIGLIESAPVWKGWLAGAGASVDPAGSSGGINALIACTAPVFWLFFLMTGTSVFLLRWSEPDRPRPFRVPLYPWTPLAFCLTSGFMLYRSLEYALSQKPAEAIVVFALVGVGLPLLAMSGRGRLPDPGPVTSSESHS